MPPPSILPYGTQLVRSASTHLVPSTIGMQMVSSAASAMRFFVLFLSLRFLFHCVYCTVFNISAFFPHHITLSLFIFLRLTTAIAGALLVYDITDSESFVKVKNWVKELRKMVSHLSLHCQSCGFICNTRVCRSATRLSLLSQATKAILRKIVKSKFLLRRSMLAAWGRSIFQPVQRPTRAPMMFF